VTADLDADARGNPFRNANLRLLGALRSRGPVDEIPFICECDDRTCFRTVLLSAAGFEQLRAEGRFAILRPHPAGGAIDRPETS